jgi:sucrose-phosphate synthase
MEIEKGRHDATADMSEDLSEGEKGEAAGADLSVHGEGSSRAGRMARISSIDAIDAWANQHKDKKLYIVLVRCESLKILWQSYDS